MLKRPGLCFDVLDEGTPGGGAPRPDPSTRFKVPNKVICQFCECELAIDGMVLKGSEKAKKLRRSEELIEENERTIAKLQQEITNLKAAEPKLSDQNTHPVGSGLRF